MSAVDLPAAGGPEQARSTGEHHLSATRTTLSDLETAGEGAVGSKPVARTLLSGLEIASGVVLGSDPVTDPYDGPAVHPLAALEAAVLPALLRGPCLVSFSGGMDSSFVLAVATRAARREGLPDPIPVTWRFTGAPLAEESVWQQRVFDSLELREWEIWPAGDDLDFVGPVAARLLNRHGVLHPANLHVHLPIVERASGGSLLTGFGGDQILAGFGPSAQSWLGHVRSRLPARLRVARRMRRGRDPFGWLHREHSASVQVGLLRERLAQPRQTGPRMQWQVHRRDLTLSREHFRLMCADHDVQEAHPFLDPALQAGLARWGAPTGLAARADTLARIAAGVLSEEVFLPRPKARFREVYLRRHTRAFLEQWNGDGVDGEFVDVERLSELWGSWPPPGSTASLMQSVWLTTTESAPQGLALREYAPEQCVGAWPRRSADPRG